jgi:hypothetical protein
VKGAQENHFTLSPPLAFTVFLLQEFEQYLFNHSPSGLSGIFTIFFKESISQKGIVLHYEVPEK